MDRFQNTIIYHRLRGIWHGREEVKPGFTGLIRVFIGFLLASWLWKIALRLAHFQPPAKTIGVTLASLSVLLIIWSIWGSGKAMIILGIKRLILLIIVAFSLFVAVNVLTIPDTRPLGTRIGYHLNMSLQYVGTTLMNWAESSMRAPDEFLFAYSGQREPSPLPPGFPTPDPNTLPVQISEAGSETLHVHIPTPLSSQAFPSSTLPTNNTAVPGLLVSNYVIVVRTGGQSLRARAQPGVDGEIVAGFPEGSSLLVLEGPVEKDGYIWWKVRGEDGKEGWCADDWLEAE